MHIIQSPASVWFESYQAVKGKFAVYFAQGKIGYLNFILSFLENLNIDSEMNIALYAVII